MPEVFLAIVFIGTLATIAGIVGLGLGSAARERMLEERLMSSHRRRVLLGMLYQRHTASR